VDHDNDNHNDNDDRGDRKGGGSSDAGIPTGDEEPQSCQTDQLLHVPINDGQFTMQRTRTL